MTSYFGKITLQYVFVLLRIKNYRYVRQEDEYKINKEN